MTTRENQSSFDKDNEYTEEENSSEQYNEIYSEELADELEVPVVKISDDDLIELDKLTDIPELSPDSSIENGIREVNQESLRRD